MEYKNEAGNYYNEFSQYHRLDGPAIEYANGDKFWYKNGCLHRENGPAIEYANGDKRWYINGLKHREDGPAIEQYNSDKKWCQNGVYHREDGPAIEGINGTKEWYIKGIPYTEEEFNKKVNITTDNTMNTNVFRTKIYKNKYGQCHRQNAPAVEYSNGRKEWYIDGLLHREDGPAIECADGSKEWFIEGKRYSEQEFNEKRNLKMNNTSVMLIDGNQIDCTNAGLSVNVRDNDSGKNNVFRLVNNFGKIVKESTSSKEVYTELRDILTKEGIVFIDRPRTITHQNYNYRTQLISKTAAQTTELSISWDKYFNYSSHKYPNIKFNSLIEVLKHIVENEHIFKLFNATDAEVKEFINTGSSKLACNLTNEYGLAYTSKSVSMTKESVIPQVITNAFTKIKSDPTVAVATTAIDSAARLAVARQGSRVLATFVSSIASALLTKLGYSEYIPMLETELGKAMLEMSSPFILHAAVTHGLIPFEKYNDYIETATRWSIDANTAHYTMKYSDQALDMFQSFMIDPKMRENFGSIIKLGVAMSKAESGNSGMLEKLVMPSFADFDALIKEDAVEIERVR